MQNGLIKRCVLGKMGNSAVQHFEALLQQISIIKMKECASATYTEIPETRQRLLRYPWSSDGKSQTNGG